MLRKGGFFDSASTPGKKINISKILDFFDDIEQKDPSLIEKNGQSLTEKKEPSLNDKKSQTNSDDDQNSPFQDLKRKKNHNIDINAGAQVKDLLSGIYENAFEEEFFLKKTANPRFRHDDIAEIFFSYLAKLLLPEEFKHVIATCIPAVYYNKETKEYEIFVASKIEKNWTKLYELGRVKLFKLYYLQRAIGLETGPDNIRKQIEEIDCTMDLCFILLICSLLKEPDCGPHNNGKILPGLHLHNTNETTNKEKKKGKLSKIDHGWAFYPEYLSGKDRGKVLFHNSLFMYGATGGENIYRRTPTNHLKDYEKSPGKKTIDSDEFAHAILQMVANLENKNLSEIIATAFNNFLEDVIKQVPIEDFPILEKEIFCKIATHLNYIPKHEKEEFYAMKSLLKADLKNTIEKRLESMECSAYVVLINNILEAKDINKNDLLPTLHKLASFIKIKILDKESKTINIALNPCDTNSVSIEMESVLHVNVTIAEFLDDDLLAKYYAVEKHLYYNLKDYISLLDENLQLKEDLLILLQINKQSTYLSPIIEQLQLKSVPSKQNDVLSTVVIENAKEQGELKVQIDGMIDVYNNIYYCYGNMLDTSQKEFMEDTKNKILAKAEEILFGLQFKTYGDANIFERRILLIYTRIRLNYYHNQYLENQKHYLAAQVKKNPVVMFIDSSNQHDVGNHTLPKEYGYYEILADLTACLNYIKMQQSQLIDKTLTKHHIIIIIIEEAYGRESKMAKKVLTKLSYNKNVDQKLQDIDFREEAKEIVDYIYYTLGITSPLKKLIEDIEKLTLEILDYAILNYEKGEKLFQEVLVESNETLYDAAKRVNRKDILEYITIRQQQNKPLIFSRFPNNFNIINDVEETQKIRLPITMPITSDTLEISQPKNSQGEILLTPNENQKSRDNLLQQYKLEEHTIALIGNYRPQVKV